MEISENIMNNCGVLDRRVWMKADVSACLADFVLSVSAEPEMTSLNGQGP